MEIKLGIARTKKYTAETCGDAFDIVERPLGGLTALLAAAQGNGVTAKRISYMVTNKAAELLSQGTRDDAVPRMVHDYLYEQHEHKVSCSLTMLTADTDKETIFISRNSSCPVLVKTDEYDCVYDDGVEPIGQNKHMKPQTYELPLEPGLVLAAYTDGVAHAGHRETSHYADVEKYMQILRDNPPADSRYMARAILEQALAFDKNHADEDMTVIVMSVTEGQDVSLVDDVKIDHMTLVHRF